MPSYDPAEVAADHPVLYLLELAVPMWLGKLRHTTVDQRIARAQRCAQVVAEHGDSLQFRDRHTREAFNALAEGLACAAYQPGGVSFAGMHWQVEPDPEEPAEPEPERPIATIDPGEFL